MIYKIKREIIGSVPADMLKLEAGEIVVYSEFIGRDGKIIHKTAIAVPEEKQG